MASVYCIIPQNCTRPSFATGTLRSLPPGDVWAMGKPTAQSMLFMGKRCLTWKCSHLLCFRARPYSGVMSAFLPLQTLNSSCWSKVDRKRKICHLAMGSPMHLLFPKLKISTFSPSTLFTSVPSALRKRSGLKICGSFQSLLEGKTSDAEIVSPGHGCRGDIGRWKLSVRTSLNLVDTSPAPFSPKAG